MTTIGQAPAKVRVALWDNARFWLIVLVVAGHAFSTVRTESEFGFGLYAVVYLFHMPAFILLAGMFSKAETSPKAVRSTVQLLLVWLTWEGLWALIRWFADGKAPGSSWLVSPAWTLWFLVSLATMRILLPYLARLRHPLLVSVLIALAAGLSGSIGTAFSASRTLVLLPFFVAGWLARERGWLTGDWFLAPARWLRTAAWAFLAVLAAGFILWPGLAGTWRVDRWLLWKDGYGSLFDTAPVGALAPEQWWSVAVAGIGVRAVLLAAAFAMIFALLLIVPRGESITTAWGARTLYVYLLHGPVIALLRGTGAVDAIGSLGAPGVLLLVAIGATLAVVLSLEWVGRLFRPIIEPRVGWLFRDDADAHRDAGQR